MAVARRLLLQRACVAVCVAGATLCALNRAPVLAAAQCVAGFVVYRARFGRALASGDAETLMATLRDVRADDEARIGMIRGTVTPNLMLVPMQWSRQSHWTRTAITFRDEMSPSKWRQLSTALRHQPYAITPAVLIKKIRSN